MAKLPIVGMALILVVMLGGAHCAKFGFGRDPVRSHVRTPPIDEARILATSRWQHTESTSINNAAQVTTTRPRVFFPTDYGADPTGGSDSTTALQNTINEAFQASSTHTMMPGIIDLGGVEVHLGGGQYIISKPLTLPDIGGGNVLIHGGTIRASFGFTPTSGYMIEVSTSLIKDEWERHGRKLTNVNLNIAFENLSIRDMLLDANFTSAGGILLLNPLRTTINNCYITHFVEVGINVQGGHETLIHSSFIGQHITAGADPKEHTFGGTAILLAGNDNLVTDVVIFSAAIGIDVMGQANIITGVHCYNKATQWGGVGIIVRQGSDQTRMLGCYMDYTGITLEETNQITITNSFFLGDAFITIKSHSSSIFGLSISHNMFSGNHRGTPIVQLLANISHVKQTFVDDNTAIGMSLRSTRIRASTMGFGTSWIIDLSKSLLFPDSISHVQYSFFTSPTKNNLLGINTSNINYFPRHLLRSIVDNKVTIVSDTPVYATVAVYIDQSFYGDHEYGIANLYV